MRFRVKTDTKIMRFRESNINRIYIMLGSACNFHCKYCLQCNMKPDKEKHISEKLQQYLWRLIKERDNQKKIHIMFWGGEPLLYFEQIKEIVKIFGSSFTYGIVSNGSLLNQNIVDFLNENDINFTLSHDGVNTIKTRRIDVIKDLAIKSMLNQINNLSVDATTSAFNIDYNSLIDYWNIVLPKAVPNIELLRVTWDMPKELYCLDLDKYKKNTEAFFSKAADDLLSGNITKRVLVALPFIKTVANGMDGNNHYLNCGQIYHNLNVDLYGNIYACHNTGIVIGSVSDIREKYIESYEKWLNTKKLKSCEECVVKDYCSGGCPLEPEGENGLRKSCAINIVFFESVEKAVRKIISAIGGKFNSE